MVNIVTVEEWSEDTASWPSRFFSQKILNAFLEAQPEQIITDGLFYKDETTARRVVDCYRRHFRKAKPGKKLQVRIAFDEAWRWFGRVIG